MLFLHNFSIIEINLANNNQQIMKRYITLFTFVCVLFLGMQTATAQEEPAQQTPELRAKAKTMDLAKLVELSDEQVRSVYDIYLAYEKNGQSEQGMTLSEARKQISGLLHPQQQKKFTRTFASEMNRQRKMEKARGAQ